MAAGHAAVTDRAFALAQDEADGLAPFRERFVVPDPALVYLDGNSLGRMPASTPERLAEVLRQEWAGDLIRSWRERWVDRPTVVGDLIGCELLGARPGEVVISDSTTVNFYKLVHAALDARPGRDVIVTDRDNFPTDRHVVEGIAAARGLTVRWVERTGVDGPQPADLVPLLDERVALVTLSHVAYRTAAIADLPTVTRLAHDAGALVLWDVCHSAGAVPVELTDSGADLAVGCSYKYLNGGPGAQSFLYVRRELQAELRQPIWGWWSQRDMFDMTSPAYQPATDIRGQLTGTASVLSLAAIEEGARMLVEAGLPRLRAKGIALTEYAIALHDEWLAPLGFALDSPRESARRGSHVAVRHERSREFAEALAARGVICGFRQPDGIRVGLAPLTTRFVDVHDGFRILAELAG